MNKIMLNKIKIILITAIMMLSITTPVFADLINGSYRYVFEFKQRIQIKRIAQCKKNATVELLSMTTWGGESKLKVLCYKNGIVKDTLVSTKKIAKSSSSRKVTFSNLNGSYIFFIGKDSSNKTKTVMGSGKLTAK